MPISHKFSHICSYGSQKKYTMIIRFFLKLLSYVSCIRNNHTHNTFPYLFKSYPIISISRSKGKPEYSHPFITENMKLKSIEPSSTTFSSPCYSSCYSMFSYSLILTYFESTGISEFNSIFTDSCLIHEESSNHLSEDITKWSNCIQTKNKSRIVGHIRKILAMMSHTKTMIGFIVLMSRKRKEESQCYHR